MAVKVSLTERMSIEAHGVVLDEQRFPGRQGRLVFAYLLHAQGRPVPKDELAEALWGDELPATWEKALSVIASKLRTLLGECGIDGAASLKSAFGCYQLTLPAESWIDVAEAEQAAAGAERNLAAGDWESARVEADTASALARRTFLPGDDSRWVAERRSELEEILARALECLAEANRQLGDRTAAARAAEELVALEPFRESGYRLLMRAQSGSGNDAEALRTYERCRTLLANELGAYPSPDTEAVYLEILRRAPSGSRSGVEQIDDDPGPEEEQPGRRSGSRRRRRLLLVGIALTVLIVVGATAALLVLPDEGEAMPEIAPGTIVRIDPDSLDPAQVVRVGREPDLVVVSGGFVWITHRGRRYTASDELRDSGDRTLTRVDPSTGEVTVVGGGLAPCGIAADPSGDVWVANCYAGARLRASVVRVDAKSLRFDATWPVRSGLGFFRGLTYGGGWLWVADVTGDEFVTYRGVTRVDPRTGRQTWIEFDQPAGWLSWSEGYGDLWMNDFLGGTVSRMRLATGAVKTFDTGAGNPGPHVVNGDTIWVGDWANPQVVRLSAVGFAKPRPVTLPVPIAHAGVTSVAAGAGSIWATVPDSRALWRIDPKTLQATRIPLRYFPWGVGAEGDEIWVVVRGNPLG